MADILIVDDEASMCETLGDILETAGHKVDKTCNGEEAIKMAEKKAYDVVFLDMKLSDISGLEAYRKIKHANSKVMTIIITAYRYELRGPVNQALKEGVYSCLCKPFNPEKAVELVEEILGGK